MGAVHIGIGHQDDLMVAQLRDIKILMDPRAEGGDHGLDLRIPIDPVQPGLFYVQDLPTQREDRLVGLIPGILCRASCRIALHDVDLAVHRILIRTVRQLAGQSHTV